MADAYVDDGCLENAYGRVLMAHGYGDGYA